MTSADAIKIMIAEGSKAFNPFVLYKFIYLVNYKSSESIVEEAPPAEFSDSSESSEIKLDNSLLD
jgi:hypothetical protein